jgi:regulator of extracellular matrix RemA (YlzA/DUF370 family)
VEIDVTVERDGHESVRGLGHQTEMSLLQRLRSRSSSPTSTARADHGHQQRRLARQDCQGVGVPTILTTVVEERGGDLLHDLQAVFPDQKPINRTFINTWEDSRVVDARQGNRTKEIVIAGLRTEICVAMPAMSSNAGRQTRKRIAAPAPDHRRDVLKMRHRAQR